MESVPEIKSFGLKSDGEKRFRTICFEIPPCCKKGVFVTEFVVLGKNLPFYEVGENNFLTFPACF